MEGMYPSSSSITYGGSGTTDESAVTSIHFSHTFYPVPTVTASVTGSSVGFIVIESITLTGFKVRTYDKSFVPTPFPFTWIVSGTSSPVPSNYVKTHAGLSGVGYNDGLSLTASFSTPYGVAFGPTGNIFVSDMYNNVIRMIDANGVVTTYAKGFNRPAGIAVGKNGILYVADSGNNKICKIDVLGNISNIITNIEFNDPRGVAVDSHGVVYVADTGNNTIHAINGDITTSYLPKSGALAFNCPIGITVSNDTIYIADTGNDCIRIIKDGIISTIVTGAKFAHPTGIAVDTIGNIYISEFSNHIIRKIDIVANSITRLIGTHGINGAVDGVGRNSMLNGPVAISIHKDTMLAIADTENHSIRLIKL